MTPDKKKPVSVRLKPPKRLVMTRHFACMCPYPLDASIQRLIAYNGDHRVSRLRAEVNIRAAIHHTEMDDQNYVLHLGGSVMPDCWAVGTFRDVDGETTWIEGEIGVLPGEYAPLLLFYVVLYIMISQAPPSFWFAAFMGVAMPLWWMALIWDTKLIMRQQIREIFGIPGKGPLPVQRAPEATERTS